MQSPATLAATGLLVAAAAMPLPAHASTRCRPSQEAGWVADVEHLSGGSSSATPGRSSPHGLVPLGIGDGLCALERVENPVGSRRRIILRLAGGDVRALNPGEFLVVPAPRATAGVGRLLDYLMGGRLGGPARVVRAAPRGDACPYRPERLPPVAFVTEGSGTLRVSWPCDQNAAAPWSISLRSLQSDRVSDNGVMRFNFAGIDPSGCTPACLFAVFDARGRPVYRLRIEMRPSQRIPLTSDMRRLPDGPVRQVAIGASLVAQAGRQWRLQGFSLLYNNGCAVPAAGLAAARFYGTPADSPEETCGLSVVAPPAAVTRVAPSG